MAVSVGGEVIGDDEGVDGLSPPLFLALFTLATRMTAAPGVAQPHAKLRTGGVPNNFVDTAFQEHTIVRRFFYDL